MQATTAPERDIVSLGRVLDRLVAGLAERLVGREVRPPARDHPRRTRAGRACSPIACGSGTSSSPRSSIYDDAGQHGPRPTFLQFPADPLLRGQRILVVDEVWDSGTTIHAVTERIRQAGGIPTTAVLHYKPSRSVVPGAPDVHAVTTDAWVVYPFKAGG